MLDFGSSSLGDTTAHRDSPALYNPVVQTDINYIITEHEKGLEGIPEAVTCSPTLLPSCPIVLAAPPAMRPATTPGPLYVVFPLLNHSSLESHTDASRLQWHLLTVVFPGPTE